MVVLNRHALLQSLGIAIPAAGVPSELAALAGRDEPDDDGFRQPVQTTVADWGPVAGALGRRKWHREAHVQEAAYRPSFHLLPRDLNLQRVPLFCRRGRVA